MDSDLGHNCFQYRFERQDDLHSVLDNRPYHFGYWMVILQQWEPVISSTFPSHIPFWIRIKGIPLHYWHDSIIYGIGRELGTFENHELTKTSARVRVHVDGLKSLTKETVMEFDTGEECTLSFEYERLENHCTACGSLSHLRKNCRDADKGEPHRDLAVKPHEMNQTDNEKLERDNRERWKPSQRTTRTDDDASRLNQHFHQRVDRHGRPFGNRAETKQTRKPPPEKPTLSKESNSRVSVRSRERTGKEGEVNSPQYVHFRERSASRPNYLRSTYSRNHLLQWREKTQEGDDHQKAHTDLQALTQTIGEEIPPRGETLQTNTTGIPSMEQVVDEIQEHTNLYINCKDPIESATRRHRVFQSEARGEVQEAAADIVARAVAKMNQSNPAEPPTLEREGPTLLLLGPGEAVSEDQPPSFSLTTTQNRTSGRKRGRPAKLRSAISSPTQSTGVSLNKRLLSKVQHSPGRAARSLQGQSKQKPATTAAGSPTPNNQPQIKLISARKKKKEDFQVPPPPGL